MDSERSSNLYWDSNEGNNLYKYEDNQLGLDCAKPSDVPEGLLFKNALDYEVQIGKMPRAEIGTIILQPGEEYIVPKGYSDGTGVIKAGGIEELTVGNATEEDIVKNKVAWVNGTRIVGSLDLNMIEQVANAVPEDIAEGKTAWVNGTLITGTLVVNPRVDVALLPGEFYTVPEGIHTESSIVTAYPLDVSTPGTATEDVLLLGYTAWVNGEQITGTLEAADYIETVYGTTDTKQEDVRLGKKFYSKILNGIGTGTMPEYLDMPITNLKNGETITIPKGYHDGKSQISVISLRKATPATAIANKLLYNETAWANGERIVGTMRQYITDAKDTTAEEWEIVDGKTAYINGYKVTGTCKYGIVAWDSIDTNLYDDTPIAIALPIDDWQSVYLIIINIYDENSNIVKTINSYNYYVGEVREVLVSEDDDTDYIKFTSDYGKNVINIEDSIADRKISIHTIGYTIVHKFEEDEDESTT